MASVSFTFDLTATGGSFRSASDGGFDFVATDGTTLFRIPGPFMTDAGAILPVRSVGAVTAKLIPLGNGTLRLTLVPDLAWLLDPSRVYPVVIDPTLQVVEFEPLGASGQNATISQPNPNTNYNGNPLLYAGKDGSGLRQDALIKFPDFSQLPAESSIVSATLEVYAASGTAGMPITLHHNAQPWDPATVTWNTAPGTTSDVWDTDTTNVGAINTFDATILARGWMSGDIPKEGVRLISTAPNGQTTAYYSSYYNDPNCTNCQPELEVTYVPATRYGNDRLWTYTSQDYGGGNSSGVNLSTGALVFTHAGGSIDARGFSVDLTHTYTSSDPFYLGGPNAGAWYGEGWSFAPSQRLYELDSGNAVAFKDGSGDESRVYLKNTDVGNTRSYLRPLHYDWTLTKDIGVPPTDPSKVYTLVADVGAVTFFFDAAGKLTRKQDRNGNYLTFGYDTSSRLNLITDVAGRTTVLEYNGTGGRLSKITDMAGRVSTYAYSSAGNLTTIKHGVGSADEQTTTLGYDDANQLVSVTDPRGHTSGISYQVLNRFDTPGSVEDWVSGTPTRSTISQSTAQHHSGPGSLKVVLTSVTAAAPGRVKKVLATPKPLAAVAAEVVVWVYLPAGSAALQAFLTVRYPNNGSVLTGTQVLTAGAWNAIRFTGAPLDPASNVKEIEVALGSPSGSFSGTAYIDDLFIKGTVDAVTDAKPTPNTIARFSEDFNARTTTQSRPDSGGTFRDTVYRYTRDGLVDRVTDPLGNVSNAVYDAFLRLSSLTPPGTGALPYQYAYYPNSNQLQTATNAASEVSRRGANLTNGDTRYAIDPLNEGLRAGGTANYDATILTRDPATGNVLSATNNRYAAGANLETDPFPAPISWTQSRTVSYLYTTGGLLSRVTDPATNYTAFGYDVPKGYLTSVDAPTGNGEQTRRVTTIGRNSDGSVAYLIDPKTQRTEFTYDGLGRLKTIRYGVVGGVPAFTVSYTLDPNGNLTAMTDQGGSTIWVYDENNRVTSESRTQNSTVKTSGYAYFANGTLHTITTLGNQTVTLGYDSALRLTSETDPKDAGRTITFGYDARSRRTTITYPSGVKQTQTFDTGDRVKQELLQQANGTNLQRYDYDYGFDINGNRLSTYRFGDVVKVTELDGSTVNYTYDDLARLSGATRAGTGPDVQTYGYDSRNNRTSRVINGTPLTFTYDAANQLTAIGSTSLTYDRNGNLLTYGTNTAAYDASNRWTSGNWAGSALTFTYDGLGQQVSRTAAGVRTDYWFDQTGMTLEDAAVDTTSLRDPSGLPLSSYTTALNDYASDRLGSITALVSTAHALTNTYRYDPWGQILASTGSAPNTLRFTAARRDPTTGYYVMGQRSYDSGVGRFTQLDPRPSSITELNRYAYAGCNPTNFTDPTGMDSCPALFIGAVFALQGLGLTGAALGIAAVATAPLLWFEPFIFIAEGATLYAVSRVLDILYQAASRNCNNIVISPNPLQF